MGKNYLNNRQSIANTTGLTFKQCLTYRARIVSEQDEVSGLETINWLGKSFIGIFVFDW